MSHKVLGMMHTVLGVVDGLHALCKEYMPEVELFDVVDDAVRRSVVASQGPTPMIYRRVCDNVVFIAESGADVVLVTCSATSPVVDVARKLVSVPVLKIDEPMAEKAVQLGERIGVIATSPATLKASNGLVVEAAEKQGRKVQVETVLCQGAYEHLLSGNLPEHDRVILDFLRNLMRRSDVIVLAQASMARVADQLEPAERTIPVLSSPRLGIERTAQVIRSLG